MKESLSSLSSDVTSKARGAMDATISSVNGDLISMTTKIRAEIASVNEGFGSTSSKVKELLEVGATVFAEGNRAATSFSETSRGMQSSVIAIGDATAKLAAVSTTLAGATHSLKETPLNLAKATGEIELSIINQGVKLKELSREWEIVLAKMLDLIGKSAAKGEEHVATALQNIGEACKNLEGGLSSSIGELTEAVEELSKNQRKSA
ncbi:MAG: hypothetical protein EOP06_09405 [Proteobacteria bacterium]|nr:MAG: hypothetical protein EOP06_09405 [Pseudomonadota bacterium]